MENMASPKHPQHKLSTVAQLDDAMRNFQAYTNSPEETYDAFIEAATKCDKYRKMYLDTKVTLESKLEGKDKQIGILESEVQTMKIHLTSVRGAYTRELKKNESLNREYRGLKRKMSQVKDLLNGGGGDTSGHSSDMHTILSELTTALYTPDVPEASVDTSDDGLLFDKSDDSFGEVTVEFVRPGQPSVTSLTSDGISNKKSTASLFQGGVGTSKALLANIEEEKSQEAVAATYNTTFASCTHLASSSPSSSAAGHRNMAGSASSLLSRPSASSLRSRPSANQLNRFNRIRNSVKYEPDRLDSRKHTFEQKTSFKNLACGVCTKNIGFCSKYLLCTDCHGVTHMSKHCQTGLPLPCIPKVSSNSALKRMKSGSTIKSGTVKLADFTSSSARPCVPAILIHALNELDRRIALAKVGSFTVGSLYVKTTLSTKEVIELRRKMLESTLNLAPIEAERICEVVKSFLRELDEPVITRVLWNDFVRAAKHVEDIAKSDNSLTDSDYESHNDGETTLQRDSLQGQWHEAMIILKKVVLELPNINRDCLSFLFLHFGNLLANLDVVSTKLEDLKRIFAFAIVGSARSQAIRRSVGGEGEAGAQMMVMSALFKISLSFWRGILKDPKFQPFGTPPPRNRTSLNRSVLQNMNTSILQTGNCNPADTSVIY